MKKQTTPWFFIPSLYLAEGFPYIIINAVSVLLYSDLGYANDKIAFWTGFLYLPWTLKMFWSPLVDSHSTKRRWLLTSQVVLSFLFLLIGALVCIYTFVTAGHLASSGPFFAYTLFGFLLGAFASATLDIATDGYYLLSLTPADQAGFVGIRTIFYRLAMILGSGLFVSAVGMMASKQDPSAGFLPWPYNWGVFFAGLGILFLVFAVYHFYALPKPQQDKPVATSKAHAWAEAFSTYFKQKNILYILLFILLYRFGEALLEKIVPLFLSKPVSEGAIGLSMQQLGMIKGTLGLGAIIAGNLLGGFLLKKWGFKKCIWPFACALVLPNIFYVYIASARPSLSVIAALITLENFGYGLAMMALTVFIMYVSQGKYKTSHYAISTGIMALGMMVPSMLSGKMQMWLGYEKFFCAAFIISLITFAIVPLAFKINVLEETEKTFRERS